LATSPDATYQRSIWQLDSVVSELIYSAIVFVPPPYCEMDVLKEKRVCIKFCQKLGKYGYTNVRNATTSIRRNSIESVQDI
jgi:hypothetical protein